MADPGPDFARLIRPDRVHGSLYTDPRVFADELARIWYRTWAGRVTYRLRLADGGIRLAGKQVLLVNRDQPLPTLAFLI